MAEIHCRHFTGYKPCGKNPICNANCASRQLVQERILIISLEALGAVLRSTVLLEAIKERFPKSHITWITESPAEQLLLNQPFIDRLLTVQMSDLLVLSALEFDRAYVVDKSLKAMGILSQIKTRQVFGFRSDARTGAILPATAAACELWELGLSDQKKFFENQKPETQLLIEATELGPYRQTEYSLPLTAAELKEVRRRASAWSNHGEKILIGINTGASPMIPYKKLSVSFQRQIVSALQFDRRAQVVLLGGRNEADLNCAIAGGFDHVIQSPTLLGLRDGILSAAACDIIFSGDSLGLHLGIALKKWVIGWFGPTCAQEIELYGRGRKILSKAACGPCWKRLCDKNPMCYDLVSLPEILSAIDEGVRCQISSSKPRSSAISFSASPSCEL